MEHKGDLADQASAQEEAFRDLALRAMSKRAARETHPDFDGEHCLGCGNEVEVQRLALGYISCVPCKTAQEKRNKLHGTSS